MLHHPPGSHPLFQRIVAPAAHPGVDWLDSMSGLLLLTPLILVSGAVYGVVWAVGISGLVAREHERGTFDMLGVTPPGSLGTSWALCMGCLYRNQGFRRVNTGNTWIARTILLAPFVLMIWYSLSPTWTSLIFAAAFYIDYIQSIVLGALVGMLVPTIARNRLDSRFLAFGVYILMQIAVYVAFLLTVFIILPGVYRTLGLSGWFAELLFPLLCTLFFAAVHEGMVLMVWYLLLERLNAAPDELDSLARLNTPAS